MVRYSERFEYLKELSEMIQSRVENQLVRQLFEVPDEYEELVLEQMILFYEKVEASRYLFRGTYRKEVENVFSKWLLDSKKHKDSEFLNQFCISRGAISELTELIENDNVFKNHIGKIKKHRQRIIFSYFFSWSDWKEMEQAQWKLQSFLELILAVF